MNTYLKAQNEYLSQEDEDEAMRKLFIDKDGPLYYSYKASKFKWTNLQKTAIEHTAKYGQFKVIDFLSNYMIKDNSQDELYKVCVELIRNDEYQNPDTFQALSENKDKKRITLVEIKSCLLYTSPSPRDSCASRMPSSA